MSAITRIGSILLADIIARSVGIGWGGLSGGADSVGWRLVGGVGTIGFEVGWLVRWAVGLERDGEGRVMGSCSCARRGQDCEVSVLARPRIFILVKR